MATFEKNLLLTLDDMEVDYDDYDYNYKSNNKCNFCDSYCKQLYITYIHPKKIKTKACYLCHIIVNFKKYHMGKVILVKSDMNQLQINKTVMEYFSNFGIIPSPSKIDKDVQFVNIQVFEYINIFKNISSSHNLNFVVFFTNNVIKNLGIRQTNLFIAKDENEKPIYDLKFFDIPMYKLTKSEKELIKKTRNEIQLQESKDINIIMKSLNNKVNDTKLKINILNEIESLKS